MFKICTFDIMVNDLRNKNGGMEEQNLKHMFIIQCNQNYLKLYEFKFFFLLCIMVIIIKNFELSCFYKIFIVYVSF